MISEVSRLTGQRRHRARDLVYDQEGQIVLQESKRQRRKDAIPVEHQEFAIQVGSAASP